MARLVYTNSLMFLLNLALSGAFGQTSPSFTPLNDLETGLYLDQFPGGLYPGGSNGMPMAHDAAGRTLAHEILPRNTSGQPDLEGNYALLSIGMSNTTQEFCGDHTPLGCAAYSFIGQASADPSVNQDPLVLVDGAKGGKSAAFWNSPDDEDYDRVRDQVLASAGLSELQVASAWVKVANPRPEFSLPDAGADAYTLVEQMGNIARALKVRYPNMQQTYLSSRTYAGYATTEQNPEPYAYESGLAVKWLIEAQINQMNGGGIDPLAGDLNYLNGTAPWLAWGPYLWADGLNPRSDGLTWEISDFKSDGTHPSDAGREKVGSQLLDFFLSDPHTQPWFLSATAGDYDNDGDVDGNDFLAWQRGESPKPFSGSDLAVWEGKYGSATGTSSSPVNAPVPEPESLFLLLTGVGLLGMWHFQPNSKL